MGKASREKVPGCKLHINSIVRVIILDLLGRTSIGAFIPAQKHSEAGSGSRGPTVWGKPPLESPAYLHCGHGWMVVLLAARRIHK